MAGREFSDLLSSMLSASFQLCEAANRKLDTEIACDRSSKQAQRHHLRIPRRIGKLASFRLPQYLLGEEALLFTR